MARFIFITGGVVSSLGKGLSASSLSSLLQSWGYKVRLRKLDPYLNVDPGTMNPLQHGEVYVTDDGAETDLDLGHYERFTGVISKKNDNVTSGQIYQKIISKERNGDFLGATVQVIPHVTKEIKNFILSDITDEDFVLCEIGGTVGDIESLPFLEAIRQLGNDLGRTNTLYIHLTLVPYIKSAGELKTKPTQHSVKELRSIGIQPDILICRSDKQISTGEREKIALFCNVSKEKVIQALNADTIYQVPINFHQEGLDTEVLKSFNLDYEKKINLSRWENITNSILNPDGEVKIGIIGKYTSLKDSYKSLSEALIHGGISNQVRVNIEWIDSDIIEENNITNKLGHVNGVLVPGGFGERGTNGKIMAANFARINRIPYFGICFGMQMAILEAARHLAGIVDASSSEFPSCTTAVVGLMTEWMKEDEIQKRSKNGQLGGTMRLGAYDAVLKPGTKIADIYKCLKISERHRHRYEVNIKYREVLENKGLIFSGLSPDNLLPEVIEYKNHPWYIGVQYHPELKSKPFEPHPLFSSYIKATIDQSRLV
jgi:CTP synthase